MRRWTSIPVLLACLLTAPDGAVGAGPADPLTDQVCAEPAGQTDTPAQPRLRRALVDGVPIAVVLPPHYQAGSRRYPVIYLLHGAQGDEDSWIEYGGLMADSAARPLREQAIVVMPRMGVVTGLAVDWVDGHRHDATLVGRTLVQWVDRTFRTLPDRRHRAIAGYSGGGLSAAHLAEQFPRTFGSLGVLSGAVDLSTPTARLAAYPAFEAEQVCAGDDPLASGPLGDPLTDSAAWDSVDPVGGAAALRRTDVYLSSGNGVPCTAEDTANLVYPTAATEPQLRQQVDTFSAALSAAGVQHVNQRRACGLHWWTRWRPDLADFWDRVSHRWRSPHLNHRDLVAERAEVPVGLAAEPG